MDNSIFENGRKLPIVEDFYTLQGEGYHAGKPAYFVRIGGCDVGCMWCDTKFSWNPDIHPLIYVDDIIAKILNSPVKSVVVTGGEPLIYNLEYFTSVLKKNSFDTFLETSGAYLLTGSWDWVCLSPKKQSPPNESFYKNANELKVIIYDDNDFDWAEKNADLVNDSCELFLQPEWSRFEINIDKIVNYILKNPKWRISLQVHKFMHIP